MHNHFEFDEKAYEGLKDRIKTEIYDWILTQGIQPVRQDLVISNLTKYPATFLLKAIDELVKDGKIKSKSGNRQIHLKVVS